MIGGMLRIKVIGNGNEIIIGDDCIFWGDVELRTDTGGKIEIEPRTSIGSGTIHASENSGIFIGKDCMLSHGIDIRSSDGHRIYKEGNKNKRINLPSDIYIGNHVWLGKGTQCLKGTRILSNSIVGAGALVTGKFDESNVIVAGHPARIIRRGINWKR